MWDARLKLSAHNPLLTCLRAQERITGARQVATLSTCCAQPKTVTTNWRDMDDKAGKRAPGLDAVGAPAAPH